MAKRHIEKILFVVCSANVFVFVFYGTLDNE